MTRIAVVFRLIYCVNDFLTNFMRKKKSSDGLVGNENSIFMHLSIVSLRVGGVGYPQDFDSNSFPLGRDFDT